MFSRGCLSGTPYTHTYIPPHTQKVFDEKKVVLLQEFVFWASLTLAKKIISGNHQANTTNQLLTLLPADGNSGNPGIAFQLGLARAWKPQIIAIAKEGIPLNIMALTAVSRLFWRVVCIGSVFTGSSSIF